MIKPMLLAGAESALSPLCAQIDAADVKHESAQPLTRRAAFRPLRLCMISRIDSRRSFRTKTAFSSPREGACQRNRIATVRLSRNQRWRDHHALVGSERMSQASRHRFRQRFSTIPSAPHPPAVTINSANPSGARMRSVGGMVEFCVRRLEFNTPRGRDLGREIAASLPASDCLILHLSLSLD
jgi:hypothetical protein